MGSTRIIRKHKKDEKGLRLAKGLTSSEFQCRCSNEACVATIISNDLLKAYKKLRELLGVPLIINSGYRCQQHNFAISGSSYLSRHMTGQAIDISKKTINHLTDDDIVHAGKTSGFTFIKVYKSFVHFDVR